MLSFIDVTAFGELILEGRTFQQLLGLAMFWSRLFGREAGTWG